MSKVLVFSATALMSFSVWATKYEVAIPEMTCQMCEGKVTEELQKTGKCSNIKVDSKADKATFETAKGKDLTDQEIKDAVKKAGYEAAKITRS